MCTSECGKAYRSANAKAARCWGGESSLLVLLPRAVRDHARRKKEEVGLIVCVAWLAFTQKCVRK